VAIDGTSLTVIDVLADSFTVSLIPHTAHMTTLGWRKTGDTVNLETDVIGRYVERLLTRQEAGTAEKLTIGFLAEHGFA
jgi:riboflavin synthase